MGHYYRYSRRKLQGPPAPGCMYAAELNKEWLRVMVDTVDGDQVSCFLVGHGDTERVESSRLQPLAPQFLHVPFQVSIGDHSFWLMISLLWRYSRG